MTDTAPIDTLLDHEAERQDEEAKIKADAATSARAIALEVSRLLRVAKPSEAVIRKAHMLIKRWLLLELGAVGNGVKRTVQRQVREKRKALAKMKSVPKLRRKMVEERRARRP